MARRTRESGWPWGLSYELFLTTSTIFASVLRSRAASLIDAQSADETVQTPVNLDLYTNPRCTRLVVRQSRQRHEANTLIAVLFEQRDLALACPAANFS
jgi:hypothetical protein